MHRNRPLLLFHWSQKRHQDNGLMLAELKSIRDQLTHAL